MNRTLAAQGHGRAPRQQRLAFDRYLAEVLLHGGLADLIPLKQRGRFRLALAVTVLWLLVKRA